MHNNRILTVSYSYNRTDEKVPFIRLHGKWLAESGFSIGDKIVVQCKQNSLSICLVKHLAELSDEISK